MTKKTKIKVKKETKQKQKQSQKQIVNINIESKKTPRKKRTTKKSNDNNLPPSIPSLQRLNQMYKSTPTFINTLPMPQNDLINEMRNIINQHKMPPVPIQTTDEIMRNYTNNATQLNRQVVNEISQENISPSTTISTPKLQFRLEQKKANYPASDTIEEVEPRRLSFESRKSSIENSDMYEAINSAKKKSGFFKRVLNYVTPFKDKEQLGNIPEENEERRGRGRPSIPLTLMTNKQQQKKLDNLIMEMNKNNGTLSEAKMALKKELEKNLKK